MAPPHGAGPRNVPGDVPPTPRDVARTAPPVAGRLPLLAAVAAGGALGTAVRLLMAAALPVGWATLAANVVGCMLLGLVIARVRAPGGQALFGTGLAGALTTFSGFAVESLTLFGSAPAVGLAYWAGSVALGVAAAAAGLRLGGPAAPRRVAGRPPDRPGR